LELEKSARLHETLKATQKKLAENEKACQEIEATYQSYREEINEKNKLLNQENQDLREK